jgi:predicted O-methyltransferase YrrM
VTGSPVDPQSVKGFLSSEEGAALTDLARACAPLGPVVEIGSYVGRSTLYLAAGAREAGGVVIAVDHHRGSEEHQPGEAWHDPELVDPETGRVNTLPAFLETLERAGARDVVQPVVARSPDAARAFAGEAGLVFIDGGHALRTALADWRAWGPKVAPAGVLAIHDVFPDARDGGRPPHEIWLRAKASGLFDPVGGAGSLMWLRRVG